MLAYSLVLACALLSSAYALVCMRSTLTKPQRTHVSKLRAIHDIVDARHLEAITKNESASVPVVIDFQKSKCKPCVRIAPEFLALSEQYDGKVLFFKVDADTSKEAIKLMKTAGIRSVPTFHVWHGGERIDTINGARIDEVEDAFRPIVLRSAALKTV